MVKLEITVGLRPIHIHGICSVFFERMLERDLNNSNLCIFPTIRTGLQMFVHVRGLAHCQMLIDLRFSLRGGFSNQNVTATLITEVF